MSLDKIVALSSDDYHDDSHDVACLATGLDAVLDQACELLHSVDLTSLDPKAQQAAALVDAACHVVDSLVDALGLHDADRDNDSVKMSNSVEHLVSLSSKGKKKIKAPYGDVPYADPGYRGDKKRYPLDAEHIHAAITYFARPNNQAKYTPAQVAHIRSAIVKAAKRFGVQMS